ncbi:hypothetical protein [Nocardiopsis sp. FIRDI 009]|uniref:hypothetical protein n=1 Tax=Nocardiopsis sp. FIRDI 009 TaxID=714197 RepID=UPI000E28A3D0|nr:hypothetical protein [Nocardiopsis sp. FIRDI 009]
MAEATAPAPDTSSVPVGGTRVALTGDGADAADLARAERRIDDRHQPQNNGRLLLWGGLVVAGLFVVLGVMTMSPVTWFLALLGLIAALVGNLGEGRERSSAAEESAESVRLHADRMRELLTP